MNSVIIHSKKLPSMNVKAQHSVHSMCLCSADLEELSGRPHLRCEVNCCSKFATDLTRSSRNTTLLQHPIKTRAMAKPAPMLASCWRRVGGEFVTSPRDFLLDAYLQITGGLCFILGRSGSCSRAPTFHLNTSDQWGSALPERVGLWEL